MPLDYTQKMYARLMEAVSKHYRCYSVVDYAAACGKDPLPDRYFIMRHDVDGNVGNALEMAKIDARCGIRATYYFRMKRRLFQPHIVRAIAELGHEIGYHYEVLSDAGGDFTAARKLFASNLSRLRSIAPVKTVCMHGASFSKYHNLDFWKENALADFDLTAEPYLTIDYSDMYYFSDTGLCWDNRRFNLRDRVVSRAYDPINNTPALIQRIHSAENLRGAMLTHTNIWTDRIPVLMFYKIAFWGVNRLKYIKKKMSTP